MNGIDAYLSESTLRQQYKCKSGTGTGSDRGSDTVLEMKKQIVTVV